MGVYCVLIYKGIQYIRKTKYLFIKTKYVGVQKMCKEFERKAICKVFTRIFHRYATTEFGARHISCMREWRLITDLVFIFMCGDKK